MKRTAVYLRVSTADQDFASQRAEIDRWLAGHGLADFLVFEDKATGNNTNRPGFKQLQKSIFAGEVGTVVIYKLDRLARSLRDGIDVLTNWIENGVRVVSVSQQFDFSGATGKLIAAVLLGVAEMEQETRRERQAAGIAVAKRKGIYKGRKVGTTTGDVSKARDLQSKGLNVSDIAATLGVSRPTVYRYLST